MESIKYISQDVLENLQADIDKNLSRYAGGDFLDLADDQAWNGELSLQFDPEPLKDLDPANSTEAEIANSCLVGTALANLNPSLATEDRIWTRLAHVECLEYSRQRWLQIGADKLPGAIRTHMFASTLTQYRDDNAISRLWWNYYVAQMAKPEDPMAALKLVRKTADIRSNIIERRWMCSRPPVLRALIRLMEKDDWPTDKEVNFRSLMKAINARGGGQLFEVMSDTQVDGFMKLCLKEARRT